MNIHLKRNSFTKDGIFGQFLDDSGSHLCYTLEHAYEQPDGTYAPKIPVGEYACVFGQHELHSGPIQTFEVTNVPGHQGILIHNGNFNADSEGCILVGESVTDIMVSNSRAALSIFLARMGQKNFTLEVS